MKRLVLAAALLSGCATTPPVVQEVKIPVSVPCVVNRPARPSFEVHALPADASDGAKILAFVRDTPRHFTYEGLLEAALAGCL